MRDALLADADPDIAEWARTKGLCSNERELRRLYDKAAQSRGPAESEGVSAELRRSLGQKADLDRHTLEI
jgi:hypothetical protein